LTIKKVQAQMEGAYECRASNGEGTDSVAANLKVVRETTIIEGKYIFDHKIANTNTKGSSNSVYLNFLN
jgi:hypothetical protein